MSDADDLRSTANEAGSAFRDLVTQLDDLRGRVARMQRQVEDLRDEARSISLAIPRLIGGEVLGLDQRTLAMLTDFEKYVSEACTCLTIEPIEAFIEAL